MGGSAAMAGGQCAGGGSRQDGGQLTCGGRAVRGGGGRQARGGMPRAEAGKARVGRRAGRRPHVEAGVGAVPTDAWSCSSAGRPEAAQRRTAVDGRCVKTCVGERRAGDGGRRLRASVRWTSAAPAQAPAGGRRAGRGRSATSGETPYLHRGRGGPEAVAEQDPDGRSRARRRRR